MVTTLVTAPLMGKYSGGDKMEPFVFSLDKSGYFPWLERLQWGYDSDTTFKVYFLVYYIAIFFRNNLQVLCEKLGKHVGILICLVLLCTLMNG